MFLHSIALTNFKNYPFNKLTFSEGINVFTGDNGSGKTNLLDAIHYLCIGKSYFSSGEMQSVMHEKGFFRIDGNFVRKETPVTVAITFEPISKKIISKNGNAYSRIADHVGEFPIVVIAPDDISLINEGSEERRRWMDNTVSQVHHLYLEELLNYNKVLAQRNALLKQFSAKEYFNEQLLKALDEQLLKYGITIFQERKKFITEIIPLVQHFYEIISEQKEAISLAYESGLNQNEFYKLLMQSRDKDRALQRTTEGIHKDDLDLIMDKFSLRRFGSQGQKKSFLTALKLAQYEFIRQTKNTSPILLLDDVFDKLDKHRVKQMLQLISNPDFGQVFITDTGENRIEKLLDGSRRHFHLFHIKNGAQPQLFEIAH